MSALGNPEITLRRDVEGPWFTLDNWRGEVLTEEGGWSADLSVIALLAGL